jgi:hypothetical protein
VAGRKRLAVQGAAGFRSITRPREVGEQGKIISDLGGAHPEWAYRHQFLPSAASSYVCLGDDAAELFVVGVVVAPDDVPADHAGLFLVAGMVGPVEREVAQRGELRLD